MCTSERRLHEIVPYFWKSKGGVCLARQLFEKFIASWEILSPQSKAKEYLMKVFCCWWLIEVRHGHSTPLCSKSCLVSHDRKIKTWSQRQTGVKDIIETIKKGKHLRDNRWTITVTEWIPRQWKRTRTDKGKIA